jgi:hypothetical protein
MIMTPDTSGWRSSPTYDYVDDIAASDLAWEWLRRNSAYQQDYSDLTQATGDHHRHLTERTRSHWGLRFSRSARA